MKEALLTTFVLAAMAPIPAAHAGCSVGQGYVLYCAKPRELGELWQLGQIATPQTVDAFRANGCGFLRGELPKATLMMEREWATKQGTARIALIDFGEPVRYQTDAYAADGQYLGKKPGADTAGWVLRREIQCDAQSIMKSPAAPKR